MFLIAMEPPGKVIPGPLIDSDYIDGQSIALPVTHLVAVEGWVRFRVMRAPIRVDHAPIIVQFVQLYEQTGSLHQLEWIGVNQKHPGNASRHTIHGRPSQLKIGCGHRFDLCGRPRLERRRLLGRCFGVELPSQRSVEGEAPGSARKPNSREIRMTVCSARGRSTLRHRLWL